MEPFERRAIWHKINLLQVEEPPEKRAFDAMFNSSTMSHAIVLFPCYILA
jgi:hypothetical protein